MDGLARRGFTLIEMLVVVSIIVLVVAIVSPLIGALSEGLISDSGLNTVQVAVKSARAYATREKNGPSFAMDGGQFSGTAIIFTPANELRIVANAYDRSSLPFLFDYNVYENIEGRDYVPLSEDLGVVGIARNAATEVILLTPPFAVRFDQHGQLIAARDSNDTGAVFYDRDYDGNIDTTRDRVHWEVDPYNPDAWDPNAPIQSPPVVPVHTDKGYHLPFERLDAVIGVVLYDEEELRNAGHNLQSVVGVGVLNDPARQWILESGTTVFFSRHSGAAMPSGND